MGAGEDQAEPGGPLGRSMRSPETPRPSPRKSTSRSAGCPLGRSSASLDHGPARPHLGPGPGDRCDEHLDEDSVRHAYEALKPMDAMIRQPNVFGPKLEPPPERTCRRSSSTSWAAGHRWGTAPEGPYRCRRLTARRRGLLNRLWVALPSCFQPSLGAEGNELVEVPFCQLMATRHHCFSNRLSVASERPVSPLSWDGRSGLVGRSASVAAAGPGDRMEGGPQMRHPVLAVPRHLKPQGLSGFSGVVGNQVGDSQDHPYLAPKRCGTESHADRTSR